MPVLPEASCPVGCGNGAVVGTVGDGLVALEKNAVFGFFLVVEGLKRRWLAIRKDAPEEGGFV